MSLTNEDVLCVDADLWSWLLMMRLLLLLLWLEIQEHRHDDVGDDNVIDDEKFPSVVVEL